MYIIKPLLKYHQTAQMRNYYIRCISTVISKPSSFLMWSNHVNCTRLLYFMNECPHLLCCENTDQLITQCPSPAEADY